MFTISVCSPYYYGFNCNAPCGQCSGDGACNNVTGHCPCGCKPHWSGGKCDGKGNITIQNAISNLVIIYEQ